MVLQELGKKIQGALKSLTQASVIDKDLLDSILKQISMALLESDVNVKLVQKLRTNIKQLVDFERLENTANKKRFIQKAIFDELCSLVDPGKEAFVPVRGKPNVIMFVGLQGAGKTTTCTKLAYHYTRKGYKVGLVCTDTFRAGAFDQLKQNATKAKIPFYGSYTESDPVQLALDGVSEFKRKQFEVIIVDTSGRHRQETELFQEMKEIYAAVVPDNVVFVLDGTIGQAAEGHAKAFKESVEVGSIVITKMDGHAKGGGAISAVAATNSPIIFIGTGEHIHDLEVFKPTSFINKMLGQGDLSGLFETLQDSKIDKESLIKNITQGKFTVRDMKGQLEMISGMGPMSKIMQMIPGMPTELMNQNMDEQGGNKLKHFTCAMDSMTEEELDSDGTIFRLDPSRLQRVARGSGVTIQEIHELLIQHDTMSKMVKGIGGPNGMLANLQRNISPSQMAQMQQQMQSSGGIGDMMNKMMQGGGFGDIMSKMMGGGGMPDLSQFGGLMGNPPAQIPQAQLPPRNRK